MEYRHNQVVLRPTRSQVLAKHIRFVFFFFRFFALELSLFPSFLHRYLPIDLIGLPLI